MGSLGQELKEAREKKGLTIKELAERTRISMTYLAALEAEDYSAMPADVFAVGFLRSYARELGLDDKAVLARYRETHRPVDTTPADTIPASHPPEVVTIKVGGYDQRRMPSPALIAGAVILLALLGISAYLLMRDRPSKPAAENAATPAVTATPQQPVYRPATTVSAKPAYHNTTSRPFSPLRLKLASEGPAWYSYQADAAPRERGVLDKGKTVEVAAKGRILLDLGNAGETKVEYNGAVLKPFGRKGEPKKNILFTKEKPGIILSPSMKNHTGVSHKKAVKAG